MLSLLTQSISNASFGIYFSQVRRTIYELLSAPLSYFEIVVELRGGGRDQVGRPRSSSWATAGCWCVKIEHPLLDDPLPVLTSVTFSLIASSSVIWADGFREAPGHTAPHHHAAHLFFGGSFYSIDMLAAILADGLTLQPRGLPGERIPLSFYGLRRERGTEPRMTGVVSRGVARSGGVDLQTGYRLKELVQDPSGAPCPPGAFRRRLK